jgi:MFS family permease
MTWAVAASVGPVIGGVLTEKVSWRWCFYINRRSPYSSLDLVDESELIISSSVPIIGTVFILIFLLLKLDTPRTPIWAGLKAVDWLGSLTVVGSTVMLLLGLELGGVVHPWSSAMVLCLIVFGIVTAGIFVLIEWKIARYPVTPLRLFNTISNTGSLLACFIHGMAFVVGTFYLPLYFQGVLGATALLSGVWFLPFAGALAFAGSVTGMYIKLSGRYLEPIWVGFILMTLGFGLLINLDVDKSWPKIIIYQIITGLGVGPNFQALLIALQNGVSSQDIATATATFGFLRNLASSIGVVVGGVIFQNSIQSHAGELIDNMGQTAELLLGGAATASTGIVDRLPGDERAVARDVYYKSLKNVWIFAVAISAVGLLAILTIRKAKLSREHLVVKTGLDAEEEKRRIFLTKEDRDM